MDKWLNKKSMIQTSIETEKTKTISINGKFFFFTYDVNKFIAVKKNHPRNSKKKKDH